MKRLYLKLAIGIVLMSGFLLACIMLYPAFEFQTRKDNLELDDEKAGRAALEHTSKQNQRERKVVENFSRRHNEDGRESDGTGRWDTILIVLGNEPLDESTPTVDMIARVNKAVGFQKEHPRSLLVFTGGRTAGRVSEARIMADLAIAQNAPPDSIRLEEKARTTAQNAKFTSELVRDTNARRVLIVSKGDHLEWAMPIFKKLDVFKNAEALACEVDRADSIAQMKEYLKRHDSPRVRQRLRQLSEGVKGTD